MRTIVKVGILGVVGYFLLKAFKATPTDQKRTELLGQFTNELGYPKYADAIKRMTDQEIADVYALVFVYNDQGSIPTGTAGDALRARLMRISATYGIFT